MERKTREPIKKEQPLKIRVNEVFKALDQMFTDVQFAMTPEEQAAVLTALVTRIGAAYTGEHPSSAAALWASDLEAVELMNVVERHAPVRRLNTDDRILNEEG